MNIKISKKVSVKQHDQSDCGAACMASVLAYYGSYNIVVFLTICISYANNCFTL